MSGDWTTCPECKGSGWADLPTRIGPSRIGDATGGTPVAHAVYEYTASQRKAYVEPCNTCRGVKEIYLVGE